MADVQLRKLSVTHEAIMDWMLANPGPRLNTRAAAYFGLSPSWMSIVVNSDAFQAKLSARRENFEAELQTTLVDRAIGAAAVGLERLAEKLESEPSTTVISDATDKLLQRLGYGAPKPSGVAQPGATQVGVFVVGRELLDSGRKAITARTFDADTNSEDSSPATLPEPAPES